MLENLGGAELMLVLLVILIFFGPKKIPELANSFGKGLRKFREAKAGMEEQFRTAMKEPVDAMRDAQKSFNKDLTETRMGMEKRMNNMLNDETKPMRDSGEAVMAQIKEAASAMENSQQTPPQIPLFTAPPNEYESAAPPPSHPVEEPVPGGVKIHKLV